jgi:hypothetical protein
VLPEEVPLYLKIVCAISDELVYSKEEDTIVIFQKLAT